MNRTVWLSILIIFVFSACSPKIGGSFRKSRYKCYEEFYVDEGVNQYFVKPLDFKALNGKEKFTIDFTFRDTLRDNSQIIANYSFFSEYPVKKIDSVVLIAANNTDKQSFKLKNCQRLFIDKNKKTYQIRYSCSLTYKQILDFFDYQDYSVSVYINGNTIKFIATKKTLKAIYIVKNEVTDIIKLNKQ